MTRVSNNDEFIDYVALVDINRSTAVLPQRSSFLDRTIDLFRRNLLLIAIVIMPAALACLYYGFVAADQYVSETRFVVRSPHRNAAGLLSGFLQSTGFVRAQDDSYVVMEFIESRAAVRELSDNNQLRQIFSRPEGDVFARFPAPWQSPTEEALYEHYLQFIDVETDSSGGITTLEVRAFRPEDAQQLALALLERAEMLINRLNDRARRDAVRFAEIEVKDSEQRLAGVQESLTAFRNRVSMVDPGKQSAAMFEMIAKLSDEVAQSKAQLAAVSEQAPQSPQVQSLRSNIEAKERQIIEERANIVGGDASMAPLIAQYEQILMQRELATRMLESAATSLENARLEAQRQQLYLERVVNPNLPDYALYPKRIRSILLILCLSLAAFWIARFFRNQIYEHSVT
ncbi:capsule biosynthesis protein [Phyllobacterium sp. 21LDTY02-6]|uniref:capsule biosynthesis protein n=1 Tax=Phyllobacterium sp. 21LDTY02-6 TaxID=2944903 RepID=UPI0020223D67|nr:capsule biosynthesis protein [Phyllobacterium sp. 21LDTY02-6]MCO4318291.1 capsule biosynthesis protein [Phyllobacterium sp. 21LDTY02-6]